LTLANAAGKSAATTLDAGWTKYFAVFEATAESDTYTVTVEFKRSDLITSVLRK